MLDPRTRRSLRLTDNMILTQCAACAAPLPHLAKQCGRCKTRYCGPACQEQHWKEGGHDKLCKKIKRGGGAEQYHADKKCEEAVAVAVEACADDTKGQTCYICTEAVHWKTKEGRVRGCSCRGTAGFAHVSCLAEQPKILVAEAEENNLDTFDAGWVRWHTCSLCEQNYHGVVRCALGWACWKTYLGRPEEHWTRSSAMTQLGHGLDEVNLHEERLGVLEAELSICRRLGASEDAILCIQQNLAACYFELEREADGLEIERQIYQRRLALGGIDDDKTLLAAANVAISLVALEQWAEAKALVRKVIPAARRALGRDHEYTMKLDSALTVALYQDDDASLGELRQAVSIAEVASRRARRVYGNLHPLAETLAEDLDHARETLARRTGGGDVRSIREAVEAMTSGGARTVQ